VHFVDEFLPRCVAKLRDVAAGLQRNLLPLFFGKLLQIVRCDRSVMAQDTRTQQQRLLLWHRQARTQVTHQGAQSALPRRGHECNHSCECCPHTPRWLPMLRVVRGDGQAYLAVCLEPAARAEHHERWGFEGVFRRKQNTAVVDASLHEQLTHCGILHCSTTQLTSNSESGGPRITKCHSNMSSCDRLASAHDHTLETSLATPPALLR
jgi:hypothetical protein